MNKILFLKKGKQINKHPNLAFITESLKIFGDPKTIMHCSISI